MSIEFYTNEELLEELFSRQSFKGIVLHASGDLNNVQEGNNKCKVRIAKGMVVKDIFEFIKLALHVLEQRFPAAFSSFFGNEIG